MTDTDVTTTLGQKPTKPTDPNDPGYKATRWVLPNALVSNLSTDPGVRVCQWTDRKQPPVVLGYATTADELKALLGRIP